MNKENMLAWADALDSGKYKQITGGWGSDIEGKYCCLNVALKHLTGKDALDHDMNTGARVDENGDIQSESFVQLNEIFGFEIPRPVFYQYNDIDHLTFPEIAAKIREMVNEQG